MSIHRKANKLRLGSLNKQPEYVHFRQPCGASRRLRNQQIPLLLTRVAEANKYSYLGFRTHLWLLKGRGSRTRRVNVPGGWLGMAVQMHIQVWEALLRLGLHLCPGYLFSADSKVLLGKRAYVFPFADEKTKQLGTLHLRQDWDFSPGVWYSVRVIEGDSFIWQLFDGLLCAQPHSVRVEYSLNSSHNKTKQKPKICLMKPTFEILSLLSNMKNRNNWYWILWGSIWTHTVRWARV
jgi:hypothetical protein